MPCIKCGRKVEEGQVFCTSCLAEMDRYPVKPGTPIQLPYRRELPVVKKKPPRKRRKLKPEEQVLQLRSTLHWVCAALIVTIIAFVLSVTALLHLLDQRDALQRSRPGQNYTVTQSVDH